MAYAKRYAGGFFDLPATTTPIDSAFLNALETSMLKLQAVDASADAQVLQWDNANSRFAPALLLNKNVDPAAAIAKSKLDFTGANGIVNVDVAGAAAIALSKLAATGTIGTSPISIAAAGKTALQIADSGAQLSGITIGGDTNLYRSAAAALQTDGNLQIGNAGAGANNRLAVAGRASGVTDFYISHGAGGNVFLSAVTLGTGHGSLILATSAAAQAFKLDTSGSVVTFGTDTNLYRASAGVLFTDSIFQSALGIYSRGGTGFNYNPSSGTGAALTSQVQGAGNALFSIDYDGKQHWGSGGGTAVDTDLFRFGATFLGTTSDFVARQGNAGQISLQNSGGNPTIFFGTAQTEKISRTASKVMMTDSLFDATTLAVATKVKAGAPVDGDWSAAPLNGTLVVDSTNNKIWARVGGVWKGVVIA